MMSMLPYLMDQGGNFGIGWTMFLYLVLLPGFLFCLLLCSNKVGFMQLVNWILDQNFKLPFNLNLATFMISLCTMSIWLSFSGMQRYQAKVGHQAVGHHFSRSANESALKMYFFESRNLALALLGFVLWSVVSRVKSLHQTGQLVQPAAQAPKGLGYRLKFVALALVALAIADIPMCRMTYNFTLAVTVTPAKESLLAQWPPTCQNAMWHSCATDGPQCEDLCRPVTSQRAGLRPCSGPATRTSWVVWAPSISMKLVTSNRVRAGSSSFSRRRHATASFRAWTNPTKWSTTFALLSFSCA